MKSNFFSRNFSASVIAAIALAGCASKPPAPSQAIETPKLKTGEQMLLESENLAKFGERWKLGQQRVQQGEETVRQGQIKIEEGERMIEEGRRMMKESEESYQNTRK